MRLARAISSWSYQSLEHEAVCAIDGARLMLTLQLVSGPTQDVPDVLDVEAWLRTQGLTTVEAVALGAAERFRMRATASGWTPTHGVLTVTV